MHGLLWKTAAALIAASVCLTPYAAEPPTKLKVGKAARDAGIVVQTSGQSGITATIIPPAKTYHIVLKAVPTSSAKATYFWDFTPDEQYDKFTNTKEDANSFEFDFPLPKVSTSIKVRRIVREPDGPQSTFRSTIVVDPIDPPTPDPDPDPKPNPDDPPKPPPGPAPIPVEGNRVLIVYESSKLNTLTKEQNSALAGTAVCDFLEKKCVMGPDGKTKEWRILDKDTTMSAESKVWQDAMARPRTNDFWVVISTGKAGYEGPFPKNSDELLTLLKKYFGE